MQHQDIALLTAFFLLVVFPFLNVLFRQMENKFFYFGVMFFCISLAIFGMFVLYALEMHIK